MTLYLRNDSEVFAASDPVDLEITIDCEYQVRIQFFGKDDECGIGEVHRKIGILFHQAAASLE